MAESNSELVVETFKLTKIYNKGYLIEALDAEFKRAKALNTTFSVLFLDLDHFKQINDRFGHDAGDAVLDPFEDAAGVRGGDDGLARDHRFGELHARVELRVGELEQVRDVGALAGELDRGLGREVGERHGLHTASADILFRQRLVARVLEREVFEQDVTPELHGAAAFAPERNHHASLFSPAFAEVLASGVSGKVANAKIEKEIVPTITDKKKFLAHVKKTGDFDLLNRAVNKSGVESRWEAKKVIPGVKAFTAVTLSITKV